MSDNPSAFPFQVSHGDEMSEPSYGMTLRDWFAGQALVGLLAANPPSDSDDPAKAMAIAAFMMAEAMLIERKREPAK